MPGSLPSLPSVAGSCMVSGFVLFVIERLGAHRKIKDRLGGGRGGGVCCRDGDRHGGGVGGLLYVVIFFG